MTRPPLELSEFVDVNDQILVTFRLPDASQQLFQFQSLIRAVANNKLLLDVPAFPGIQSVLIPNFQLGINFQPELPDFPTIMTTIILFREADPAGCWVEVPPGFHQHFLKRRRHIRVPVQFPLKAFFTVNNREFPLNAQSVNLSGGGMRFTSKRLFQENEVILLEFKPDERGNLYKVKSRVVLSQPVLYPDGTVQHYVTAVAFLNLERYEEDRLVGFCFRQELLQQRHLRQDG